MSAGNGWIGSLGQLLYTLRTFHAQEDEQGNIILTGEAPAVFMGIGEESSDVVVPAGCGNSNCAWSACRRKLL